MSKVILEQTIKEVLEKMDFSGEVMVQDSNGGLVAKIESDEAGFLIGQGGENLAALQHLLRAIVNHKILGEMVNFSIDVNNYRANRLELLREMASELASQVQREQRTKILAPMPPYERRFVHLVLKDFPGVKTESQGEGEERRIIIKPAED